MDEVTSQAVTQHATKIIPPIAKALSQLLSSHAEKHQDFALSLSGYSEKIVGITSGGALSALCDVIVKSILEDPKKTAEEDSLIEQIQSLLKSHVIYLEYFKVDIICSLMDMSGGVGKEIFKKAEELLDVKVKADAFLISVFKLINENEQDDDKKAGFKHFIQVGFEDFNEAELLRLNSAKVEVPVAEVKVDRSASFRDAIRRSTESLRTSTDKIQVFAKALKPPSFLTKKDTGEENLQPQGVNPEGPPAIRVRRKGQKVQKRMVETLPFQTEPPKRAAASDTLSVAPDKADHTVESKPLATSSVLQGLIEKVGSINISSHLQRRSASESQPDKDSDEENNLSLFDRAKAIAQKKRVDAERVSDNATSDVLGASPLVNQEAPLVASPVKITREDFKKAVTTVCGELHVEPKALVSQRVLTSIKRIVMTMNPGKPIAELYDKIKQQVLIELGNRKSAMIEEPSSSRSFTQKPKMTEAELRARIDELNDQIRTEAALHSQAVMIVLKHLDGLTSRKLNDFSAKETVLLRTQRETQMRVYQAEYKDAQSEEARDAAIQKATQRWWNSGVVGYLLGNLDRVKRLNKELTDGAKEYFEMWEAYQHISTDLQTENRENFDSNRASYQKQFGDYITDKRFGYIFTKAETIRTLSEEVVPLVDEEVENEKLRLACEKISDRQSQRDAISQAQQVWGDLVDSPASKIPSMVK